MTNYVSLLTVDELNYLCSLIPVRLLKDYYDQENVEFHKLRKVRPQTMTDKAIRSFTVGNAKAGFISHFLNKWISTRLKEIEANLNALIGAGKDKTDALVETLTDCVFSDRIEVYYTLIQDMPSPDYLSLIKRSIVVQEQQNSIQVSHESIDDVVKDYEEKLAAQQTDYEQKLEEQRSSHKEETQALQKESEAKLSDIRQTRDELMVSLEVAKGELEQANEALGAVEARLAEYEKHADIDIDDEGYYPSEGFSYISLCENYTDSYERKRLRRLADITEDGRIVQTFIEDYPYYERLFRNDGPSADGTVAIWDWSIKPNQKDPSRTVSVTSYNHRLSPTIVIIDADCIDTTDLVARLHSGIEVPAWANRILYACYHGAAYEGVLLRSNMLSATANKYRLKDSVLKLRVFEVRASDILHFESLSVSILGRINLGMPTRIIQVRDSMEIVCDAILSRSSWAVLKQLDFTHAQYQQVKNFLTELPQSSLYEEIAEKCDCDLEEATVLVHRFIENANAVLDGKTISTAILSQSIRNNSNMYQCCLKDLRSEWEAKNKEDIAAANAALEQIKAQERECQEAINQHQQEHDDLERQITEFKAQINAQEQLAADVEERVKRKIELAKKQAADFIAENAFINPISASHTPQPSNAPAPTAQDSYTKGSLIENEDMEEYRDWTRLLKTIQEELSSAGVADKALPGLSACLYSAYLHRAPIMLAGPYGTEIAKAFSVSLNAHLPDIVQCDNGSAASSFDKCRESESEVILIKGLFSRESYANTLQLIEQTQKFCIAVHPYAEDLVIEPTGFTNYFVPIFTDIFVENRPSGEYIGGKKADDCFTAFEIPPRQDYHRPVLNQLRISEFSKRTVQQILSDMRKMLRTYRADYDYTFILYPLAYATGNQQLLLDYAQNCQGENKPSTIMIDFLKQLIGEDE